MITFNDDTQLSMFTADGLIKSSLAKGGIDSGPDMETMFASYQDWYRVCAVLRDKGLLQFPQMHYECHEP